MTSTRSSLARGSLTRRAPRMLPAGEAALNPRQRMDCNVRCAGAGGGRSGRSARREQLQRPPPLSLLACPVRFGHTSSGRRTTDEAGSARSHVHRARPVALDWSSVTTVVPMRTARRASAAEVGADAEPLSPAAMTTSPSLKRTVAAWMVWGLPLSDVDRPATYAWLCTTLIHMASTELWPARCAATVVILATHPHIRRGVSS